MTTTSIPVTAPPTPAPGQIQGSFRALPRLVDGIDPAVLLRVPENVCRTHRAVPYAVHDGRVLVAAVDPRDAGAARAVAERLDAPVLLVRHPASEVLAAIARPRPREVSDPTATAPGTPPVPTEPHGECLELLRIVRRSELVSEGRLREALAEQAATGDRLGDVLVGRGHLTERQLVDLRSAIHGLPRVELTGFRPDLAVVRRLPETTARRLRALPVAEDDGTLLLAVARPLAPHDIGELDAVLTQPYRPLLAPGRDVDRLHLEAHGSGLVAATIDDLAERFGARSAHGVVTPTQQALLVLVLVAGVSCAVLWPRGTLLGAVVGLVGVHGLVLAHQATLARRARRLHDAARRAAGDATPAAQAEAAETVEGRDLPVYTVLVPLPGRVTPRLLADLDVLDYPRTRLEVLLLCRPTDTADAADAADTAPDLPAHVRVVVLPDGPAWDRALACDYGLRLASGSHLVVHDAGDLPDPHELHAALAAFAQRTHRPAADVGCVIAARAGRGTRRGVLAAWSAAEHALHADLVPAIAAGGSPVPLGLTTGHFRTSVLRDLGGWDPGQTSPDDDLGLRLRRRGLRTLPIDAPTGRNGATDLAGWLGARSRAAAGSLQTWLVHQRRPVRLLRDLGPRGYLSHVLATGATAVLLLNPVLWVLLLVLLLAPWSAATDVVPAPVLVVAVAMLLLGNLLLVDLRVGACVRRKQFGLIGPALLSPVAWALASLAAWHGVLRLLSGQVPTDSCRPNEVAR